jgi:hypothetical protein
MIVPIYLDMKDSVIPLSINENIWLVHHQEKVSAYNVMKNKVGNLSSKTICNKKYINTIRDNVVIGRVWAIFGNKILVEVTE